MIKRAIFTTTAIFLVGCGGGSGEGAKQFTKRWNIFWQIASSPNDDFNGYWKIENIKIDCDDTSMAVDPQYGRRCKIDYSNAKIEYALWEKEDDTLLDIWRGGALSFGGAKVDISNTSTPYYIQVNAFSSKYDNPTYSGTCWFEWKDEYISNIESGKEFLIESVKNGNSFLCRAKFEPIYQ